ncbi:WD domain, G-beta repeat [Carpediemonas membranifera]|uniref:Target of rapamycin complex subunit LST8 n=1 Tax=Carpediemonas membranifera TaxID=201153 RepID=A0A8J6B3Q1_9EUKA|nr:WD domain, G-beta repeat [Carpediemonas membranifera]|eukprot:KAG9397680.1 WD domain, G-beta repeat [Carpediemonas membranifera]
MLKFQLIQTLTPAHGGTITAITPFETMFFTASTDSTVKVWRQDYNARGLQYTVAQTLPTQRWVMGWVTSMQLSSSSMVDVEVLYCSTTTGDVLLYKRGDTVGGVVHFQPLYKFDHFTQLAISKVVHISKEDIVAAISYDKKVRIYGQLIKSEILSKSATNDRRFTAIYFIGETAYLGDSNGGLTVVQIKSGKVLYASQLPGPVYVKVQLKALLNSALEPDRSTIVRGDDPAEQETRVLRLRKAIRSHKVSSQAHSILPVISIDKFGDSEILITRPHCIETYMVDENPARNVDAASLTSRGVHRPFIHLIVSHFTELSETTGGTKLIRAPVTVPKVFKSLTLERGVGHFLPQIRESGKKPSIKNLRTPRMTPDNHRSLPSIKTSGRKTSLAFHTREGLTQSGYRALNLFKRDLNRMFEPNPHQRRSESVQGTRSEGLPKKPTVTITPDFSADLAEELSRLRSTPNAQKARRARTVMASRGIETTPSPSHHGGRLGVRALGRSSYGDARTGLTSEFSMSNRFADFEDVEESDEALDPMISELPRTPMAVRESPEEADIEIPSPLDSFSDNDSISDGPAESCGHVGYGHGFSYQTPTAAGVLEDGCRALDDMITMHRHKINARSDRLPPPGEGAGDEEPDPGLSPEAFEAYRSKDSLRLYGVDGAGMITVWHPLSLDPLSDPMTTHVAITAAETIPDTPLLITGHEDGVVRMWDIVTADNRGGSSEMVHKGMVTAVAVHLDRQKRITILSCAFAGPIYSWGIESGPNGTRRLVFKDPIALSTRRVTPVAMGVIRNTIVIGTAQGKIIMRELGTSDEVAIDSGLVDICMVSSGVGKVLVGTETAAVGLLNMATKKVGWSQGHTVRDTTASLLVCRIGDCHWVTAYDCELIIWGGMSSTPVAIRVLQHDRPVSSMAWNQRDRQLIIGTDTPAELRTFQLSDVDLADPEV